MHICRSIVVLLCCCVALFVRAQEVAWVNDSLVLGDEKVDTYLPLLQGKRVALFSNQTGRLSNGTHVLDVLVEKGVNVTALFSPEHGFRGDADAGELVASSVDTKTGIPIFSLYDKKQFGPSGEAMRRFDVLVVDIQDVGLRFYTYYISMLRLMNGCSECGATVVILDRPNPNGHFVDGPLLDMNLKSGVGALPIPVVHGLTLGELAFMATGEGWVNDCGLVVIPCSGYSHKSFYRLPLAPSPNLPNMISIYLYPSICYFEGTSVSLGRGTPHPFQLYGHPNMKDCDYSFTPKSVLGAKNPPQLGQLCHGVNLSQIPVADLQQMKKVDLSYVIDAYQRMANKEEFFLKNNFFDKLIGRTYVRQMIVNGYTAEEIRAKWQTDVGNFKQQRKKYLLYAE